MMSILIYKGHTLEGNTLAANYKLSWLKMERKVDKNTLCGGMNKKILRFDSNEHLCVIYEKSFESLN